MYNKHSNPTYSIYFMRKLKFRGPKLHNNLVEIDY